MRFRVEVAGNGDVAPPGLVFLFAMFGSFLWVVHNSSATPAADEIRVQKKRVVKDALIAKNGIIRAIWGLRYGSRKRKSDCRVSAE